MNNPALSGEPYPTPWLRISFIFLAALLFFILCYHFYSQNYRKTDANLSSLSGRVYLSLVPLLADGGSGITAGIYEYDLATHKVYKTLVDKNDNMMPSYQDGGSQVLYSSRKTGSEYQIQLYDEHIKLPPFAVTNSTSTDKRFPAWSPDKKALVFTAHRQGIASSPNEWSVYMINFVGKREERIFSGHASLREERIASGYSPLFSRDGDHIMYLKNDGVYSRSVRGGSERKLADGVTSLSSRFSISDDGTRLVWTRPEEKVVEVYSIAPSLSLTLRSQLKMALAHPYFVGDKYLVGIAESSLSPGTFSLIALEIGGGRETELLSLRLFDRNRMFLSDIRQ